MFCYVFLWSENGYSFFGKILLNLTLKLLKAGIYRVNVPVLEVNAVFLQLDLVSCNSFPKKDVLHFA